jgi:hypothetical protein
VPGGEAQTVFEFDGAELPDGGSLHRILVSTQQRYLFRETVTVAGDVVEARGLPPIGRD